MRRVLLVGAMVACSSAVAALIACSGGKSESLSDDSVDGGGEDWGSVILGPDSKPAPKGQAGTGLATGLPCDIQGVIENRCIACHDGSRNGVQRMGDYAALMAPAKSDPTQSLAVVALARMKSTTAPMPPPPAVRADAEEVATWEGWVKARTPKGALCTTPPPDGGTKDAGSLPDAGPDAAAGCASGVRWTDGNEGSPNMHPGLACNACHQQMGGPNLRIAGTVYKAPNDVNDCNGAAPPPNVTVTITDSRGRTATATANAAGNFLVQGGPSLMPPLSAKLTEGAKTRVMVGTVTSGDCNSCHTAAGANGAPGRILVP